MKTRLTFILTFICLIFGESFAIADDIAQLKAEAEKGGIQAAHKLAFCYEYGEGVTKDKAEAKKWEQEANEQSKPKNLKVKAERGDAEAQFFLALRFARGSSVEGIIKDPLEALKLYRKAADQGYAWAQLKLGDSYGGDYDSIHSISSAISRDDVEAVKWYRKAAEQGLKDAMFNLGVRYRFGRGVDQDIVSAHAWYNVASAAGHDAAQSGRSKLESEMTPEQIAEATKLAHELVAKIKKK